MKTRKILLFASALFLMVTAAGCRQSMANMPRYDPYEPSTLFADGLSARPPVENTVSRDQNVGADPAQTTGAVDGVPVTEIPMQVTEQMVQRGQERYDIYCAPCHGYTGDGNGMAVQRGFPAPQTLHQDRLRSVPPGYLFVVITNGFGRMPPYNVQVPVDDRWAIISYVRALQLSQAAPGDQLPAEDQQQLGGASQ